MNTLSLDKQYSRNPKIESKDLQGALVLMDLKEEDFFGVNPVGTHIWNLLENPITPKEIIKKLLENYEVSDELCQKHTQLFLEDLIQRALIQAVPD